MGNQVGAIPDFTGDESQPEPVVEEVVETTPEVEVTPEGAETPADPLPANEPPAPDPSLILKQVQGLEAEKAKLLEEVKTLRGTRREIKQEQIAHVESQIDDLKDVNPDDVSVIEKVLRSKGYMTKGEVEKMSYEATKQEELDRFLEKYPEYKKENDPDDIHWNALQRELGYYRLPEDPRKTLEVLERAHRNVARPTTTTQVVARKQQVAVAGHGSGGVQRPSAPAHSGGLTPAQKAHLLAGGWTEEELKDK